MANCRGINPGVPKHKAGKSPANFRWNGETSTNGKHWQFSWYITRGYVGWTVKIRLSVPEIEGLYRQVIWVHWLRGASWMIIPSQDVRRRLYVNVPNARDPRWYDHVDIPSYVKIHQIWLQYLKKTYKYDYKISEYILFDTIIHDNILVYTLTFVMSMRPARL